MTITEPKRLFDAKLKLTEEIIANTSSEKWIVSDLWISNSANVVRAITIAIGYQGDVIEEKRVLLPRTPLEPTQSIVVGSVILEPNEILYAYSDGEVHAFYDLESPNVNGNLKFIAKENGVSGNEITLKVVNPQVISQELSCIADASDKTINISLATDDSIVPVKANLITEFLDPNNDVVVTSKKLGADGNNIQVEIINAGNDQILDISEDGWLIIINAATDTNGNITTIATQLVDYINANSTLVDCALAADNDGTGFIREMTSTNLTGGVNATVTTTGNDIINLLKTNGALDALVYIERLSSADGTGVVDHITVTGTHNNLVNLIGGDYDKYNANHVGITDVHIVGFGRVV